jgi:hypothetical protein
MTVVFDVRYEFLNSLEGPHLKLRPSSAFGSSSVNSINLLLAGLPLSLSNYCPHTDTVFDIRKFTFCVSGKVALIHAWRYVIGAHQIYNT